MIYNIYVIYNNVFVNILINKLIYIYIYCVLSLVRLFVTPWAVAHQVPLSMEFSRQDSWNGLPFPTRGDLPDPGIESVSLVSPTLAGRFFTTSAT